MNVKDTNYDWGHIVGWMSSLAAILMFATYIDQIRLNLSGQTGSMFLPLATAINCFMWVLYAFLKQKSDWPIIFANSFGVIMGLLTFLSAFE